MAIQVFEAAAIKAVEAVDECVGKAVEAIKEVDGQMFICADHGNAEQLIDYETGEPFTAHTTNPVPFILVNADPAYTLRENGCLADIIPTLIQLMGMEQPKEMTGNPSCREINKISRNPGRFLQICRDFFIRLFLFPHMKKIFKIIL